MSGRLAIYSYPVQERFSCTFTRVLTWCFIVLGVILPLGVSACVVYIFLYEVNPCSFGEWTEWEECTAKCGHGVQVRSRPLLAPSLCHVTPSDMTVIERQPCFNNMCGREKLRENEELVARSRHGRNHTTHRPRPTRPTKQDEKPKPRTHHVNRTQGSEGCTFFVSDWRMRMIGFVRDDGEVEVLVNTQGRSDGVAYDPRSTTLFWTEVEPDAVMYTYIQEGLKDPHVHTLTELPNHADAIALDWSQRLVFVGVKLKGILITDYTGNMPAKYMAWRTVYWCEGLAVDQVNKMVYFSDVHLMQIYQQSYSDLSTIEDSEPTLLVVEPRDSPMGLYLNTQDKRLYWILGRYGDISSLDLTNTTARVQTHYESLGQTDVMAWSLVKCHQDFYFTSFKQQGIFKVEENKEGEAAPTMYSSHRLYGPVGLALAQDASVI